MKIEVLGTSFTVQSDQDPAYLREITEFFKQKVADIQRSVSTTDPLKTSILAGLLAVDEYFKYRSGSAQAVNPESLEASRITLELIRELDKVLDRSAGNSIDRS